MQRRGDGLTLRRRQLQHADVDDEMTLPLRGFNDGMTCIASAYGHSGAPAPSY
jgi:hypothetical protein